MRDYRYPKKRIFGLDPELEPSKQSSSGTLNLSPEEDSVREDSPNVSRCQRISVFTKDMSKMNQVLLASVVLVVAILLAEQSLHLLYHGLCWTTNILAGLRLVAFSLPEAFSAVDQQQHQISSGEFDQFVKRVEVEMLRLHSELDRIKDREKSLENVDINKRGEVEQTEDKTTTRIEDNVEELRLKLQEYQDSTESIRSENLSKLRETMESLARRLTELESSNVTAQEVERSVAAIRQEVQDWREKTVLDSSSVQAKLQEVFEKYSDFPQLKSSIEELGEKTDKLKLDLESKLTDPSREVKQEELRERTDWASSELGASIAVGPETTPSLLAPQTEITVFGVSVWRQQTQVNNIIHRPHSGQCWYFAGSQGSVVLNISKPINLDSILMDHPNFPSSPRRVTVTDLSR